MPATVAAAQRPILFQLQDDRGLRRLRARLEERVLRHRDVDARVGHFGDRGDGAGDLALERAAIVHLLEELGLAEGGAVEDLEADAARGRQAVAREVQPQPIDLILRHLDVAAAVRAAGSRPSASCSTDSTRAASSGSMSAKSSRYSGVFSQ